MSITNIYNQTIGRISGTRVEMVISTHTFMDGVKVKTSNQPDIDLRKSLNNFCGLPPNDDISRRIVIKKIE